MGKRKSSFENEKKKRMKAQFVKESSCVPMLIDDRKGEAKPGRVGWNCPVGTRTVFSAHEGKQG